MKNIMELADECLDGFKAQKTIKMFQKKTNPDKDGYVYLIRLSRTKVRSKK